jgi:hypothetical protein
MLKLYITYLIHYTTSRLSSCTNKRKQVKLNNKPKAKGGANMYSKPVRTDNEEFQIYAKTIASSSNKITNNVVKLAEWPSRVRSSISTMLVPGFFQLCCCRPCLLKAPASATWKPINRRV